MRASEISPRLVDSWRLLHIIEGMIQINGRIAMVLDLANLVQDRRCYRLFAFLFATIS